MRVFEPPRAEEIGRLVAVARGRLPADVLFVGGQVLNVYSGEVLAANLAVAGRRIAYVGPSDRAAGPGTRVVEVGGRVLAPAYFEPHCHPYMLYNPLEFCRAVLPRGTTTVVADEMLLFQVLGQRGFERLLRDLEALPLRFLWGIRVATERTLPDGRTELFPPRRVRRSLGLRRVVQSGELTTWPSLLAGDERLLEAVAEVRARGLRVDGHAAGCSYDTVAGLAAAGVSADHESITAQEVLSRVRLGLHAMLRFQSLRPDLRELLRELRDPPLATQRLMLTTDGSSPPYFAEGFSDRLVRIALEEGLPPATAYQLASLNPATYYGLEADLGGLAPGRLADVLVLRGVDAPTPEQVYVEGRLVARQGELVDELPRPAWASYGFRGPRAPRGWLLPADRLRAPHSGGPFPVMRLEGPAISRREDREVACAGGRVLVPDGCGLLYAALVDRRARWVSQGLVDGFATSLDGFASSWNAATDVVAVGRRPESMARAVELVFAAGGGIALVDGDQTCFFLPLPLGGLMSDLPMFELIARVRELQRLLAERGHPYHDPVYTLLFFSSDTLPDLRLTPAGLFMVKGREVLRPAEAL